jgi:hypothetical protein
MSRYETPIDAENVFTQWQPRYATVVSIDLVLAKIQRSERGHSA